MKRDCVAPRPSIPVTDPNPESADFKADFVAGMRRDQPEIPSKYFYDEIGSRLYEQICDLEEYFPARTEVALLERFGSKIRNAIGPSARIVEFGSGSGRKTRLLLAALNAPAVYIPFDISREPLRKASFKLKSLHPELEILPVCADYTKPFSLPTTETAYHQTVIFFPGSTIGNFLPEKAAQFLAQVRRQCAETCSLLIGIALQTDPGILQRAYDDAKGITARFNRNVLWRAQREFDAQVAPEDFAHQAIYNQDKHRIEMSLVSTREQWITVEREPFPFPEGRSILTEYSYKYTLESFSRLAATAGFRLSHAWTDPDDRFGILLLDTKSSSP